MARRFYVLGLLLVVALLSGCELAILTPTITSATLATGYENDKPVGETTTFAPSDRVFHLIVRVANAPDDTKVEAKWLAVDEGDLRETLLNTTPISLKSGENIAHFQLTNDRDWPTGPYKVEIRLDGKLDRTLEFKVQ